jgi:purine-nucleoside phosphorylase
VLSAWSPELAELRRLLRSKTKGAKISAASAGVGLVEAAMGATLAIAREQPEAVLFVGTAGKYKGRLPGLELGDAVAVRELTLWSDEVASGRAYFPAPLPSLVKTTPFLCRQVFALGLPLVTVACPLGIHTKVARPAIAVRPDVENLEAFAVARAAARYGLPFMAILGISNLVGPSAHREWRTHARAASSAACRAAHALMSQSGRPLDRAAGRQ